MAKAATLAMRRCRQSVPRQKGERRLLQEDFQQDLQRTLRAINKPPSGYVLNPAVYIHTTINYADIFETGKTITGNPFLWLPLPSVPPIKGRPHMTPRQYIQQCRAIGDDAAAQGGLPMLGAVVETGGKTDARTVAQDIPQATLRRKDQTHHNYSYVCCGRER